jgi:hypothetical protein
LDFRLPDRNQNKRPKSEQVNNLPLSALPHETASLRILDYFVLQSVARSGHRAITVLGQPNSAVRR